MIPSTNTKSNCHTLTIFLALDLDLVATSDFRTTEGERKLMASREVEEGEWEALKLDC